MRPFADDVEAAPGALARIVANEDRLAEAASEVSPLSIGRVISQPAFPHVFDANQVRHPRLDEHRLDVQLHRLSEPLRAVGARHLQLVCDAGPLSEAVRRGLSARGFSCDVLFAMVLGPQALRRPLPSVELYQVPLEAPFDEYAGLMQRMSRDEPWYSPSVAREIVGSLAAKARSGAIELCVARHEGTSAGAVGFSVDAQAGVAAILTVGTVNEMRHRGVAQSMVMTLAERARGAGCDLVYLIARSDDTPWQMYRKFGFEVAFRFETWLRPPR